jgi:hypothetical protein
MGLAWGWHYHGAVWGWHGVGISTGPHGAAWGRMGSARGRMGLARGRMAGGVGVGIGMMHDGPHGTWGRMGTGDKPTAPALRTPGAVGH